jgi:hypothetical protein
MVLVGGPALHAGRPCRTNSTPRPAQGTAQSLPAFSSLIPTASEPTSLPMLRLQSVFVCSLT